MKWLSKLLEANTSKTGWILRHGLFWIVSIIIFEVKLSQWNVSLKTIILNQPCNWLLTYTFIYGVLPKFLNQDYKAFIRRLFPYILFNLIVVFFNYHFYITFLDNQTITPISYESIKFAIYFGFMGTNLIIFAAACFKILRYWYQKEQANQAMAREKLTVELQLLKAQIHPHFLFNTLNNIYSLTLKQSNKAPEMVLKLSGLLHYMLHECNGEEVLLTKEIEVIENYIALEKLRYGKRLQITMDFGGDLAGKKIAPLLLIPLVENAFKHGTAEQTDQSHISLNLLIISEMMIFRLENSKNNDPIKPENYLGGIGLKNVKKRLDLIYTNHYELKVFQEKERFVVELKIDLNTTQNQRFETKEFSSIL